MKIELLKNYPEFIDELNELFYQEWHHFNPDLNKEQWKENLLKRVNDEVLPTTIIALEKNILLGSAALVVHDMNTRKELSPWLAGVYVKAEYRKNGIGSKLVTAIEKLAKKLEFQTLYLFTPKKEKFYSSLNWKAIEKTSYKNKDVVIMKKDI